MSGTRTTPPDGDGRGLGARLRRLRREPVAGLVAAIVALPDGLAAAAMVGVNPVLGLYASAVAPVVGGALSSTQRMQIGATSASAIAAAGALAPYPADLREQALVLLVLMIGGFLTILGLLRAGRLTRFVSHAVMTGFLLGVAAALVLNQLPPLLGYRPPPGNPILEAASLLTNLDAVAPRAAAIGGLALAILILLRPTRWSDWSPLIALVAPTLLTIALGWTDVATVGRHGQSGLPLPQLPQFGLITLDLAGAALAIAVVIAVQGAGVSQSAANLDGTKSDVSRDMIAQGGANLAGSLFSAIPAGGSVGQTALNISLGAISRWSVILSGLWMLAFIALIPHLVARVPMPVLAALMVMAGFGALNWREALSVWRIGGGARWAILITFAATLLTSIPSAVAIGVVVTIAYFVMSSAADVSVLALEREADGGVCERPPPVSLGERKITILEVRGSLFFAGARTLAEKLPDPRGSSYPVVILRLRGYSPAGATLIDVLDRYADRLAEVNGVFYLSGVGPELAAQLMRADKLDFGREVHIIGARPSLGVSTREAAKEALAWLEAHPERQ